MQILEVLLAYEPSMSGPHSVILARIDPDPPHYPKQRWVKIYFAGFQDIYTGPSGDLCLTLDEAFTSGQVYRTEVEAAHQSAVRIRKEISEAEDRITALRLDNPGR